MLKRGGCMGFAANPKPQTRSLNLAGATAEVARATTALHSTAAAEPTRCTRWIEWLGSN